MIRTTLNWTVKNLKAMYDEKATLSFNHPIQRQSAQWTNEQQSLLIHSMLDNFPVPAVYIHKVKSVEVDARGRHDYEYSVLDGKQRITTIFGFINGEFGLSDDTPEVTIDDTEYEIAGKFFDDLDEEVQQEILRFKFNIQAFEDVTDETIEEIFFRLNNSTPLTKPQKAKPLMGVNNSIFINEILESRFFTDKCNFTKRQLIQSADLCTLLQGMMLLDSKYRGYEFPNISDDEVMAYSKWINSNYPDECRYRLKKIIAFLDNLFYMKEKNLRKVSIPILFLMADKALKLSINGTSFRRWFYNFFDTHKDEYNKFCSSGSVKKEKTIGRIEVMEKCFNDYFRAEKEQTDTKNISADKEESIGQESSNEKPSDSDATDTKVPEQETSETSESDKSNSTAKEQYNADFANNEAHAENEYAIQDNAEQTELTDNDVSMEQSA